MFSQMVNETSFFFNNEITLVPKRSSKSTIYIAPVWFDRAPKGIAYWTHMTILSGRFACSLELVCGTAAHHATRDIREMATIQVTSSGPGRDHQAPAESAMQ